MSNGDHIAGDGAPEAPRQKCCVKKFDAPLNRGGQRDGKNADGTVYLYEHFEVEAEFENAPSPCACRCCEYRQYIKGEVQVDKNPIQIDLIDPANPANTIPLSTAGFYEDYRDYGGGLMRDGHRTEDPKAGMPGIDKYTPDRATGCAYATTDEPGFRNAPDGHCYRADLTFKGAIVAVCPGGECAGCIEKEWTVTLKKNF